jgi:hypothetical protein
MSRNTIISAEPKERSRLEVLYDGLASVTMRLAKQGRNCPAPVGLRLRDRAATPRIIEVSKQQAETAALHVGPEIGSPLRT